MLWKSAVLTGLLLTGTACSAMEASIAPEATPESPAELMAQDLVAPDSTAPETLPETPPEAPPDSIAPPYPASPRPTPMSFQLENYQWQNRVLLVFAPSSQQPDYQEQMQQFATQSNGFAERDLLLVQVLADGESRLNDDVLEPASADRLRQQFGVQPDEFVVILIGKDGTSKREQATPVDVDSLFAQIDGMPMRQREMQERE
ncbi:DUF4174 domain-containing protein [Egbenema bharatensis]|uniref:DUF4174 domain-containing protein n=1 Tax=Egbenema bharatensis TaxID=3463334 RepID=UPI003A8B4144